MVSAGARRGAVLAPVLLAIAVAYAFFTSAGRMHDWPTNTTFLDDQAEGFRAGHLHLAVEPSPELLAKADPRDGVHRPLWYWDASLYKRHYYLYWGPVPALLLTGFKVLFRISAPIADQYPTYVLALLQLVAGTLLIERLSRRLFDGVPTGLVALAVAAFGFAAPTCFNLARPAVYEAAILGGQAFALLGLMFGFDAVWRAARGEGVRRWQLPAAGGCWALALGCRLSLAPAIPPLLLLTAWFAVRGDDDRWRRRLRALLAVGLPVGLMVAALLAYNRARFDGWLEFGRNYQLSWIPFTMRAVYAPYNVYAYLARPLVVSCKFPFLIVNHETGDQAFPHWIHLPDGYGTGEPLAGMLTAVPWSLWALAALAVGARSFWRTLRSGGPLSGRTASAFWLVVGSVILGSLTMLVVAPLFSATMRYLGDAVGSAVLLGTMGAWWLRARFGHRPIARGAVTIGCVVLAVATIAIGTLLGFQGEYPHVRLYNPVLMDRLEQHLSVCRH